MDTCQSKWLTVPSVLINQSNSQSKCVHIAPFQKNLIEVQSALQMIDKMLDLKMDLEINTHQVE